jgi:hypothetical protein
VWNCWICAMLSVPLWTIAVNPSLAAGLELPPNSTPSFLRPYLSHSRVMTIEVDLLPVVRGVQRSYPSSYLPSRGSEKARLL